MTETIQRIKFQQIDELPDERAELAVQARRFLGYHKLAQAIVVPDALMFTLRKLGIEPLVKSQVDAYMRKKARSGMWSGHKTALILLGCIAVIVAAWAKLVFPALPGEAPWATFATVFPATGCVFLACGVVFNAFYKDYRGTRIIRSWKSCSIPEFQGNIPEFALAKAVQLKRELPKVQFEVEALHEERERIVRPLPDPFLVAVLGDERYYIDVWDEKEYEARL